MADGIISYFFSDFEVYSAGTKPELVNPYAIQVMKDINIDISNNSSNHTDEYINISFDYVFTVCDNAKEICPVYPYAKRLIHKSFIDPANAEGSEEEKIKVYMDVRDGIKEYFISFFNHL
tara:strand:- start:6 stop:365 length:360 start_codon:yes stop_codon:yes gene_type:complete